ARADAMLADATAGRDRVLADIDRLRVARDRLAASFEEVRRALEIGEAVPSPLALDDAPAPSVIEPAVVGRVDAEPADEATVVEAEPVAAEPVAAVPAEPEPEPAEPTPEWEPEPEPADVDPMDDHPDAGVEVDSPPPVARGGRGSTVRLVPPAGGTPVAPPADDDFEGVRIIEPEPVADDVEPVADDAEPAADADEEGEPVDGLFTRLRAERAAKVADAEAVLAERAPDPAGDHEDLAPAESAAPEEPAATETDGLEPDLAVLAARDEAIAAVDRGLVRALKRALADEQNEVLDALRRLRGRPGVEALLPDAARHRARFAAVLGDGAAAAAAAGGDVAGGAAVANEMGGSIAADLRSRVTRSVDDAGSDVETLAEAVSAIYREWKTAKAEPLARDVVNAGYAAGTYAASAGPVRWVVDPAEGGCPDCDDNALAGPTGKGQAFPTGQLHPPAHDGCRCLAVPAT
ncbi:MAG TPA: hypothetical protein VM262_07720, partial [Acidimicrobiales bacterium]|nr:hypothetical protein [Acidimicrobiales bacterium]